MDLMGLNLNPVGVERVGCFVQINNAGHSQAFCGGSA